MQNKTELPWIYTHTEQFNALTSTSQERTYTNIFVNFKLALDNIQSWTPEYSFINEVETLKLVFSQLPLDQIKKVIINNIAFLIMNLLNRNRDTLEIWQVIHSLNNDELLVMYLPSLNHMIFSQHRLFDDIRVIFLLDAVVASKNNILQLLCIKMLSGIVPDTFLFERISTWDWSRLSQCIDLIRSDENPYKNVISHVYFSKEKYPLCYNYLVKIAPDILVDTDAISIQEVYLSDPVSLEFLEFTQKIINLELKEAPVQSPELLEIQQLLIQENKPSYPIPSILLYQLSQTTSVVTCQAIIDAYYHWAIKFERVNTRATPHCQRHFKLFMAAHQTIIAQLVYVMGAQAFTYLETFLIATDVLKLDRFLMQMPLFTASSLDLMKQLMAVYSIDCASAKACKDLEMVLQIICTQSLLSEQTQNLRFQQKISDIINTKTEWSEIRPQLEAEFIHLVCGYLSLDERGVDHVLFHRLMSYLPQIISAQLRMKNDPYQAIFHKMLQQDLEQNPSLNWMHDETQESPVGQQLAKHNKGVQQQLIQCGIDVEQALNYSNTLLFDNTLYQVASIDSQAILPVFLRDVEQLLHLIRSPEFAEHALRLSPILSKHLEQLIKNIGSTKKKFDPNNQANQSLLNAINKTISTIATDHSLQDDSLWRSFWEYAGHYKERLQAIQQASIEKHSLSPLMTTHAKSFKVVQWDKSKMETYWLGNDVGCCLATDGAHFSALIQRRMDDAMLFHVVVEAETELPVALSWLYFAKDEHDPSKVYVMANFIEIAAKYAQHPELQRLIVKHLLYFTEQYCQAIHAESFLINHSQYGWIDDFTCFEQKKIKPVKVGGCLQLNATSNDESNSDSVQTLYFLESLEQNKFHICQAVLFEPDTSLALKSCLTDAMEQPSQTSTIDNEELIQQGNQIHSAEDWIESAKLLDLQQREVIYRRKHAFLEPVLIRYIQRDFERLRLILKALPPSYCAAFLRAIAAKDMLAMIQTYFDMDDILDLVPQAQRLSFLTQLGTEKIQILIKNPVYIDSTLEQLKKTDRHQFLLMLGDELQANILTSFNMAQLLAYLPERQHEWLLNLLGSQKIKYNIIHSTWDLIRVLSTLAISQYNSLITLMGPKHLSKILLRHYHPDQDFNQHFSDLSMIQRDAFYSLLVIAHQKRSGYALIVLLNAEEVQAAIQSSDDLSIYLSALKDEKKWQDSFIAKLGAEKINALITSGYILMYILKLITSSAWPFILAALDDDKINEFQNINIGFKRLYFSGRRFDLDFVLEGYLQERLTQVPIQISIVSNVSHGIELSSTASDTVSDASIAPEAGIPQIYSSVNSTSPTFWGPGKPTSSPATSSITPGNNY